MLCIEFANVKESVCLIDASDKPLAIDAIPPRVWVVGILAPILLAFEGLNWILFDDNAFAIFTLSVGEKLPICDGDINATDA